MNCKTAKAMRIMNVTMPIGFTLFLGTAAVSAQDRIGGGWDSFTDATANLANLLATKPSDEV
jgi:hypothetical protein